MTTNIRKLEFTCSNWVIRLTSLNNEEIAGLSIIGVRQCGHNNEVDIDGGGFHRIIFQSAEQTRQTDFQ